MSLRFKIEFAAILGLAGIGLFIHFVYYERQIGAKEVEAADAKAVAAERQKEAEQAKRDLKVNQDATDALKAERDRLADIAARPAPVIRVCDNPPSGTGVPATASSTSGSGQGTTPAGSVSQVPGGTNQGVDIGPAVQLLAIWAERLAAQDRALLERERGL
jgi:hypothetical protein